MRINLFYRKIKATHWIYLLLHVVLFLLGLVLIIIGNADTYIVAIGTSLISVAVAGWVLFLYIWLSQDEFKKLNMLRRFGILDTFENRSISIKHEYDSRLSHVKESIDIMGFGLCALKEDYHNDFTIWASRAKVRILLLDPEFPSPKYCFANQRDKEENKMPGTVCKDVHDFVKSCSGMLNSNNLNFEIRLYRCLPSINIFRIDGNLFWGPYLIGDVSRNFPTFIVEQPGILYNHFLDHFNKIWSDDNYSRAVPAEWITTDATTSKS
jgi:hypothetical protein